MESFNNASKPDCYASLTTRAVSGQPTGAKADNAYQNANLETPEEFRKARLLRFRFENYN